MKILDNLDLSKGALQNAAIQGLAAAPTDPVTGQIYFDTVANALRVHQGGGTWALRATDAALLNGSNAAYYLGRANHTGTQTASTISDLASTVQAYRLDQFAAPTASVSLNSQKITGLAAPTANGDAATYDFVIAQIQASSTGISVKDPVRVVATSDVTRSGLQTIDGVALNANDRVLLVAQADATTNGVWLASVGAWTRPTTEDATSELKGAFWLVNEGTVNQKTQWIVNNSTAPVVGTDNIIIVQFGATTVYTASNGVQITGVNISAQVVTSGGITAGASGLAVDTAIVARKYSAAIGDGASTSIVVTHNLGTRDITVSVRDAATNEGVWTTWIANTTSQVTLTFREAPSASAYRVTVTG